MIFIIFYIKIDYFLGRAQKKKKKSASYNIDTFDIDKYRYIYHICHTQYLFKQNEISLLK